MTDTTTLTIEQRLAAIEQQLAAVTPLAAVPPMTIGELTNVPVPGSNIAAQWAQDVSSRVMQRFPTTAALKAWAAPVGAFAVALDTGFVWRRAGGPVWTQFTPWTGSVAGNALNGVQSAVVSTLGIPADPSVRIADVSATLYIEVSHLVAATVGMTVDGVEVSQAHIPSTVQITTESPVLCMGWNLHLHATNIQLAPNKIVQVTTAVVVSTPGLNSYITPAGPNRNRLDVLVLPRGS